MEATEAASETIAKTPPHKVTEMANLVDVMEMLRVNRKDNEFRWTSEGFTSSNGKIYQPENLEIIKTYRFEGDSNPSDNSIIYIIKANDGLVGYSLDAYGVYSNHEDEEGYDTFIRKILVKDRDDQQHFLF